MCNPRRVQVTATRQINQAWETEVRRSVELSGVATGVARIIHPLDASLGGPALRALDLLLSAGQTGWAPTQEGYRHDVQGGYVIYRTDDQSLEIVAEVSERISALGQASQQLQGRVDGEISETGEAGYYDDNWGNRTKKDAERDANRVAEERLAAAQNARIEQERREAVGKAGGAVEEQARAAAQLELDRQAAARRERLSDQARSDLQSVGAQCRMAFHRLLAAAYREAILAYARQNGADQIRCEDDGESVNIEFMVQG